MNKFSRMMDKKIIPIQPDIRRKTINYREKLLEWNPYSKKNDALFYQFETGDEPDNLHIIPDTCVDIVFCCKNSPTASVAGINVVLEEVELLPNTTYFGIKPYTVRGIKHQKFAWSDTVGQNINFVDMFGDEAIVEDIYQATSFEQRIRLFQMFAKDNLIDDTYYPDLVEYSEILMCQAKGNVKIEKLSSDLGYTGRHCREKFKEAHGISIKSYNEMLRFQNTVRMLESPNMKSIADIVYENSYYDQSHFIREFKKFTNLTPVDFRKKFVSQSVS